MIENPFLNEIKAGRKRATGIDIESKTRERARELKFIVAKWHVSIFK